MKLLPKDWENGWGRVESNLLLILILLGVTRAGSGGLSALALDTAVTSSTVRRGKGEVDVLLRRVCVYGKSESRGSRRGWMVGEWVEKSVSSHRKMVVAS